LRVIGGTAKGRRLQTPPKNSAKKTGRPVIRPTADRAREALFSIIGSEVENGAVLDLFAGTGALGLEALSRGARFAVFVDRNSQSIKLIRNNIELCGFSDRSSVIKRDLAKSLSFLEKLPDNSGFSIIFIDPPYKKGLSSSMIKELSSGVLLASSGLVIVEDDADVELPISMGLLTLIDQRHYGDTGFWFYRAGKTDQQ